MLSSFLLLGSLTSASSSLSRMGEATSTSSRTASPSATSGFHELTFIQEGSSLCNGTEYWLPWSVTLSNGAIGSLTKSNPSNATMVFSNEFACPNGEMTYANGFSWSSDERASTITFLVPYGSYSYEVVGPSRQGVYQAATFGRIDFSPSNTIPVVINLDCC